MAPPRALLTLMLCIPAAQTLVMAPSRRVIYKAATPKNTLRHSTLRVRRRQVVQARQPKMIFGLQRMFNWLTPTDIGAAVICTYLRHPKAADDRQRSDGQHGRRGGRGRARSIEAINYSRS